ncbi:MAG: hypothetical protein L3V56_06515 [Candidatus Magnetoovum sp. WYHC-5]|nr:hypothetical protein [Candidatus Magnetoovum sp. WYHC-5]
MKKEKKKKKKKEKKKKRKKKKEKKKEKNRGAWGKTFFGKKGAKAHLPVLPPHPLS